MASKKFSDLPPMQQGIILACLPVLLAVIVFYNFVAPLSTRAKSLKAQFETLHAQNLRARQLEARRADFMKQIATAQAELEELQQIVPDKPADDQFVKAVYGTAAASAVHLRSMTAQPVARQTYYTSMPFQLRLDGTYYGLLSFFTRLANSPRIVNITALTLGPPNGPGRKGSYQVGPSETVAANCILTTFYNSPPPPPPPKAGPRRR
ncbi:MAG TPA: type 4a pilus biogenesis protein PilO [Terriglobia bacterium]|nr:type 4a pilus biogenesis protein PilO [Terriglobia bacterium]